MRSAYRILGHAIAGFVAIQAAAIALWVFGLLHWVDDGHSFTPKVADDRLDGVTGSVGVTIHSFGAMVVAVLAIVLLVISFFAKIEGGVRWAALVFLAVLVQWVTAIASFSVPGLGALHGLNALLIAWLGWRAAKQAGVVDEARVPAVAAS
jgi:hypothetical protein